jgi:hypothetical protein
MTVLMIFVFLTAGLITFAVVPMAYNFSVGFSHKRTRMLSNRLDRMMPKDQIKKVLQLYIWAPLCAAAILYFSYHGSDIAIVWGWHWDYLRIYVAWFLCKIFAFAK